MINRLGFSLYPNIPPKSGPTAGSSVNNNRGPTIRYPSGVSVANSGTTVNGLASTLFLEQSWYHTPSALQHIRLNRPSHSRNTNAYCDFTEVVLDFRRQC